MVQVLVFGLWIASQKEFGVRPAYIVIKVDFEHVKVKVKVIHIFNFRYRLIIEFSDCYVNFQSKLLIAQM
jgi:hypothetical protein